LRFSVFSLFPLIIELSLVLGVIGYIYPWEFFTLTLLCVIIYIIATFCITEWRAKYFKGMAMKDN
jgi:ATP-binding cassette subfamily B protein